ncbi:hypothetical protein ACFSTC_17615 [Nonomuraea ferruginea]
MRWESMAGQGYHTPTDRFFVRHHTFTPRLDAATWRLRVHGRGCGGRSSSATTTCCACLARTLDAAIECAGNG